MTETDENLPLSRTKRKLLAQGVADLAYSLVEMPVAQFKRLKLKDELAAEVVEARNTVGRGSHKRQVKHLAGVLRSSVDELPALIAAIEGIDQVKRSDKRSFHKLEDLRDRLCDEQTFSAACDEMVGLWPAIDRGVISRLSKSVHTTADKRAYREIFKRLRDVAEQQELADKAGE